MSSGDADVTVDQLLRPVRKPSKKFLALSALLNIPVLLFIVAWGYQLAEGMQVTGLSDWGSGGGVTWGLYIGSFIWWVGIAHGGIIVSAAVRLIHLDKYEPVARMAELLTIGALLMAATFILVHLGRPDRVVTSILPAYPATVNTSPLVWDVTVITLYFVLTATYLALTLRSDIYKARDKLPDKLWPLYSALLAGYDPEEDEIVERMVWWLALAIIVLAPLLLHGGVIPWLFALLPSMPGWFGGLRGPQFLSAALTSALGGVILASYAFRVAYDWDHILTDDVIKGLGSWMGFFTLMFLWLQIHDVLTSVYAPEVGVGVAGAGKLATPVYWFAIGILVFALAYVAFQSAGAIKFRMSGTLVAAVAAIAGVLIEKTLFVFEGIIYANNSLYEGVPGNYTPSWVEITILIGTMATLVLFFMGISKVFPVIELKITEEEH